MPGIKTSFELYLYQPQKRYWPYLFTTIMVFFSLSVFFPPSLFLFSLGDSKVLIHSIARSGLIRSYAMAPQPEPTSFSVHPSEQIWITDLSK